LHRRSPSDRVGAEMNEGLIQNVADTAFLVAHCRALESARGDAFFCDPFAGRLAGDKGGAILQASPGARMTSWMVAVRTVIIDGFIQAAVARGVDRVVNLGAGLDTRPYRLELPGPVDWVEVDYPDVIQFKSERMVGEVPRCELERVGLDLADVDARRALLARLDSASARLLVLTEGVVPYLDLEQAGSLAADIHALRNVDAWIVDYVSPESHAYRRRAGLQRHMRNAPFKFEPADWFAFFAERGWRVRDIRYLAEEGARLGRRAPLPWRDRLLIRLLRPLVPRERRRRLGRFAGYAMLEPERAPS
jgi:methyltransferase (TIGR00027 family)